MAIGDFAKSMLGVAGDVVMGAVKDDQAIRKGIRNANKKAIAAGKRTMEAARKSTPNLTTKELRQIKKEAMLENGFRDLKLNSAHKAGKWLGGGIRDTVTNMKGGQNFGQAITNAHKKNGKLNMGKMAGTYVGVSSAARIATGGGLTKDKNGNTNLIGIPFI